MEMSSKLPWDSEYPIHPPQEMFRHIESRHPHGSLGHTKKLASAHRATFTAS